MCQWSHHFQQIVEVLLPMVEELLPVPAEEQLEEQVPKQVPSQAMLLSCKKESNGILVKIGK
jgi:hypothetical protein